jgi:hypothetical protein
MPNTTTKQTKEKYTETIAYDKHHDQPKPITTLFLSNLVFVTRRRFSLFGGSRTKLDSRKTHITSQNVHIHGVTASKFLKLKSMHTCFASWFSIPHTSVLIPLATTFAFGLSLSREHTVCFFFLAAFGTLHGEGGAGSMAEMEKRDC